jgi:hypothetical protein
MYTDAQAILHVLNLPTLLRWRATANNIIHLMSAPEGNSLFCFPESLNVSRDEVEGNIEFDGKQN